MTGPAAPSGLPALLQGCVVGACWMCASMQVRATHSGRLPPCLHSSLLFPPGQPGEGGAEGKRAGGRSTSLNPKKACALSHQRDIKWLSAGDDVRVARRSRRSSCSAAASRTRSRRSATPCWSPRAPRPRGTRGRRGRRGRPQ